MSIRDNILSIKDEISDEVNLVAVSKTRSIDEIKEYWDMIVSDAFNQGFVLATNIPEPKIIY